LRSYTEKEDGGEAGGAVVELELAAIEQRDGEGGVVLAP
jgi:hypothetical protein